MLAEVLHTNIPRPHSCCVLRHLANRVEIIRGLKSQCINRIGYGCLSNDIRNWSADDTKNWSTSVDVNGGERRVRGVVQVVHRRAPRVAE